MMKRTLWTVSKGDSMGYIESSYKSGFLIKTDYITFCPTFTKSTNIQKVNINTFYLPIEQKNRIQDIMMKKTPICISARIDVLGSPLKGNVYFPGYVLDIKELEETKNNIVL